MNFEALLQNIFYLLVIAIILEAAVMALFSLSAFQNLGQNVALDSVRDIIVLLVAFLLCWKINPLSVFAKTGILNKSDIHKWIDIIISTLVLVRLTKVVMNFTARMKSN